MSTLLRYGLVCIASLFLMTMLVGCAVLLVVYLVRKRNGTWDDAALWAERDQHELWRYEEWRR